MDVGGQIQQQTWLPDLQQWRLFWSQPRVRCEVYAYCGAFAYCDSQKQPFCTCLWGFEPSSSNNWDMDVYSDGCKRTASLQCSNSTAANGAQDKCTIISNLALPVDSVTLVGQSFDECQTACLNDCSCTAFAYSSNCSLWKGDVINLKLLADNDPSGRVLYYRLAASEFVTANRKKRKLQIITASASAICFVIAVSASFLCWTWRKRLGKKEAGEDLLSFDFSISPAATKYSLSEGKSSGPGRKEVECPLFRFSSVLTATSDFSPANKLGEGGFGPVYKGKLLNGHEVAVKRLSQRSGQGLEELKNEAMLIAKLQHKNLVKLLGCCIEGDEKILIYEYMANKSLDHFLFGPTKHGMLDWGTRAHIIEGIAQGLLYLHQFSRVQIIHRDLKASNILLDKDMTPKISDFGMARIFGGKESQATRRIVGTYGYMSPEYALEGIFSVKSDVFSFGVLLLEILSGKKNTGFYHNSSLNLLGYACDMWRSGRPLELVDPTLGDASSTENTVLRYINIGLLCVQDNPSDRPTMSDVVSALGNEAAVLRPPKQPAFSNVRSKTDKHSSKSNSENCSVNDLSISIVDGR